MNTQNNQSFMTHVDLITLQADKTIEKIAYKLLLKLASGKVLKNGKSGGCNMDAYNILFSYEYNGLVTIEDLTQTMYLFLLEHSDDWYLYRTPHRYSTDETITKLIFFNDETQKNFFRIVSNELYNNIRKHDRKKLWIELDNELIKIDDIPTLASHTCIDDIITLSLYNQFTSYLLSVKPKKAQRYIDCINLRLKGYKYKDISNILNIKETTIKDTFSQLKQLWKEFNK